MISELHDDVCVHVQRIRQSGDAGAWHSLWEAVGQQGSAEGVQIQDISNCPQVQEITTIVRRKTDPLVRCILITATLGVVS